jgi:hypothetical protein
LLTPHKKTLKHDDGRSFAPSRFVENRLIVCEIDHFLWVGAGLIPNANLSQESVYRQGLPAQTTDRTRAPPALRGIKY